MNFQKRKSVTIKRDKWGIPHIFGKTDEDTAFGLAYAHCEDDWQTIKLVCDATHGRASQNSFTQLAIQNDYFVQWLGIEQNVDREYAELSPKVRAICESYADGVNAYAKTHAEHIAMKWTPISGRTLAAGFIHKLPYFMGIDRAIVRTRDYVSQKPNRVPIAEPLPELGMHPVMGSNAQAVHRSRSTDDVTRLNINSHQPWEGPVAWYEAHLVSEEGWNMIGVTFPGAPFILHGHNEHLGWAHTVNRPNLIEVYELTVNDSLEYEMDGKWKPLEVSTAKWKAQLGFVPIPLFKKVYRSEHGPVLKIKDRFFAFRSAGFGKHVLAAEQWYRMNRATNLEQWQEAMRLQAIPMFNTVYADRENIFYVYNALLAENSSERRKSAEVFPGNRSDCLSHSYLKFEELPQVHNPKSGFVQNCNSSPFLTTTGEENPKAQDYDPANGIELTLSNRAQRSLELFGTDDPTSREDFLRFKFDRSYSPESNLVKNYLQKLLDNYLPQDLWEEKGLSLLSRWNLRADTSEGAALGVLTISPIATAIELDGSQNIPSVEQSFQKAVRFLKKHYQSLDVPLGTVQRLRRGKWSFPLESGADLMNAVYSSPKKGQMVGHTGDCSVHFVEFHATGVQSHAIHQYGSSSNADSVHFADQSPLFIRCVLRPTYFSEQDIDRNCERQYHPLH